ncbi:hypothetical protein L9F63_008421, partial [Diploptera punctata]
KDTTTRLDVGTLTYFHTYDNSRFRETEIYNFKHFNIFYIRNYTIFERLDSPTNCNNSVCYIITVISPRSHLQTCRLTCITRIKHRILAWVKNLKYTYERTILRENGEADGIRRPPHCRQRVVNGLSCSEWREVIKMQANVSAV